ncbi:ParB/RepB/Spo0J family partition protein [uncultured Pseudacidovorax sp.]|uniref:ParB/RepB/Spo0J family partition protein n=1 Tax=uncultured Pseudacidovorax sp. TaxID=679313 RepID=UPI0025E556C8|nr:ParB/RepB/Spo0J family partition protein [uncultured Pseudacidovorax sp.]
MTLTDTAADSGTAELAPATAGDEFLFIDLALIVESRTNPRKVFYTDRLQELADSIKASGVHQPILVRPLPASRLQETFEDRRPGAPLPAYEVIAGHRRFRASQLAGKDDIPAIVKHLDDAAVLELQLVENLQRDDLHAMEEAEGYEQLCEATGITKKELGAKIGKSREYVYARLKLLDLCQEARKAFYDGLIDSSRALVIARVPDAKLQAKALEEATAKDWRDAPRHNFKSFQQWVQQNMMLRLDAARFKITDESLVPEVGSCKECPKRTGAQPEVFPDIDSADVCIDPPCFHAKEEASDERTLAAAREKGQKIIPMREAQKLWQWDGGDIDGYCRLDRPDPRVGGSKMLKTILGKQMPEPILLQNPHKNGELVEVLPRDKVNQLLKAAGRITPQQARSERTISAQEAARRALEKIEKTWRRRAIEAVHAKMVDQAQVDATVASLSVELARAIALEVRGGLRAEERQHVCQLLGLGKVADAAAIEDYLREATAQQAEQAMLLLLMEQDTLHLVGYYASNDGKPTETPRINAVAAHYHVPLEPIKEAVRAEVKASTKPKDDDEPADEAQDSPKPKKSTASPAAGTTTREGKPKRGSAAAKPKTTEGEARESIAAAMQAAEGQDQAPDGAGLEHDAALAASSGQAAAAAVEEEGAAPAAPASTVAHQVGDRVRVRRPGQQGKGEEGTVTQVRRNGKQVQVCIPDPDGGESTFELLPVSWLESVAQSLWPFPRSTPPADAPASALPAAAAEEAEPEFKLFDLARVKADSKVHSKSRGRVGRVAGLANDGRVQLRFGPRSHELLMVATSELEPYSCALQLMPGNQVRVLHTGMLRDESFLWRTGEVSVLASDGWLIKFPADGKAEACEATFLPEHLEVLS